MIKIIKKNTGRYMNKVLKAKNSKLKEDLIKKELSSSERIELEKRIKQVQADFEDQSKVSYELGHQYGSSRILYTTWLYYPNP